MPAALIVQLLITYGPAAITLIDGLIARMEASGNVSAAEWSTLSASLKLTAQDHMRAQLKAAGVDLNSPQAVALLAATK